MQLKAQPDTIFRVTSAKRGFVLRIRKEPLDARVLALQSRWLTKLHACGIDAPQLVHPSLPIPGQQASLYTWVEGKRARDARDFVTPAKLRAVGAATARLHLAT